MSTVRRTPFPSVVRQCDPRSHVHVLFAGQRVTMKSIPPEDFPASAPADIARFDSTLITFDSTTYTFDQAA